MMCQKVFEEKNGFWDFNALRSWFKVPDSATPNEIDRESVQKGLGFWMGHDVMSGITNHLLVQETVVSVVMMSFPRQKTNKPKLAKQCGRQASKIKTKSF